MTGNNSRTPGPENALDLASAFSGVRGERPFSPAARIEEELAREAEDDRQFLNDISRTPKNTRQLNLALFAGRRQDTDASAALRYRRDKESAERLERMARMAAWDAQKTIVGGVEMTNAEAQAARARVCQNGDAYARWAVREGHIRQGEEEQFKQAARRMHELKEAERENGELSADQKREWDGLSRSRVGQAVDKATAAAHLDKGASIEATGPTEQGSRAPSNIDGPVFPTAPPVNASFANATAGVPLAQGEDPSEPSAPRPTAKRDAQVRPGF